MSFHNLCTFWFNVGSHRVLMLWVVLFPKIHVSALKPESIFHFCQKPCIVYSRWFCVCEILFWLDESMKAWQPRLALRFQDPVVCLIRLFFPRLPAAISFATLSSKESLLFCTSHVSDPEGIHLCSTVTQTVVRSFSKSSEGKTSQRFWPVHVSAVRCNGSSRISPVVVVTWG